MSEIKRVMDSLIAPSGTSQAEIEQRWHLWSLGAERLEQLDPGVMEREPLLCQQVLLQFVNETIEGGE